MKRIEQELERRKRNAQSLADCFKKTIYLYQREDGKWLSSEHLNKSGFQWIFTPRVVKARKEG